MIDFFSAYEERVKNTTIYPRSYALAPEKLILFGAPKSGKTSLALDLARHYKKPLFIDCADPRVSLDSAQKVLLKLFLEKRFDMLIIDNYTPAFTIPNHSHIIITSHKNPKMRESKIAESKTLESSASKSSAPESTPSILADFSAHCIHPLSFEEYVSFSKSSRLESIFASFVKDGNLPEMLFLPEFKCALRHQEIIALHFQQNAPLVAFLLAYQSREFSTYNVYCHLKQQQKISKDRIYALIQQLADECAISLLPHAHATKRAKLYFYNFALPYALSPAPNFQAIFENMIFCEFARRELGVVYDDECDFVLDSSAFFAMPFPSQTQIDAKLARLSKAHEEIIFISVDSNVETHTSAKGAYKVMSFIDFALEYFQ